MKYEIVDEGAYVVVGPVQINKKVNPNWEEQARVWQKIWKEKDPDTIPSRNQDFESWCLN